MEEWRPGDIIDYWCGLQRLSCRPGWHPGSLPGWRWDSGVVDGHAAGLWSARVDLMLPNTNLKVNGRTSASSLCQGVKQIIWAFLSSGDQPIGILAVFVYVTVVFIVQCWWYLSNCSKSVHCVWSSLIRSLQGGDEHSLPDIVGNLSLPVDHNRVGRFNILRADVLDGAVRGF